MSDIKYFRDQAKYPDRPAMKRWGIYTDSDNLYNSRAAGWDSEKIKQRDTQFGVRSRKASPAITPKIKRKYSLLTEEIQHAIKKNPISNKAWLEEFNKRSTPRLKSPRSPEDEMTFLTSTKWNLDYNELRYKLEKLKM